MIKLTLKTIIVSTLFLQGHIMASPFSFEFPNEIDNLQLQSPKYLSASDNIKLAYYDFVPIQPKAIVIFYHGGGIWSTKIYQYMAQQLAQTHNIGIYLFDIRGHGNSQGPRGDTPSTEQCWRDINKAINFVHQKHSGINIVLAGHSSGAGLILNYSNWHQHPAVSGYLFLAPFLGPQSKTSYEHTDPEKRFIKNIRLFPLIMHAITKGFLFTHTPVIFFNYPQQQLQKDSHILKYYTAAMAQATTPHDARAIFAKLNKPFFLIVGACDEQFIPEKIIAFHHHALLVKNPSISRIVPKATHLSIVTEATDIIADGLNVILSSNNI